jgi:D-alanine-D-alanine ligase
MRVVIVHQAVALGASLAELDVLDQVKAVERALHELGHEPIVEPCTLNLEVMRARLLELQPDVVFNLVEGLGGSDWLMFLFPGLLDTLGIPYTGSPTTAIFLSNHKLLSKQRMSAAGVSTPAAKYIGPSGRLEDLNPGDPPAIACPWIIKTAAEHASFGLDEDCVYDDLTDEAILDRIREHSARLGRPCFAEQYIDGRELNISLLAAFDSAQVLPPAEIEFVDYPPGKPRVVGHTAKWIEDSFEFNGTPRTFVFADADRPMLERVCDMSRRCWDVFGLRGYARVDFRVDSANQPYVLEINANPCLTPGCGFPWAADYDKIDYRSLVARILADAQRPRAESQIGSLASALALPAANQI